MYQFSDTIYIVAQVVVMVPSSVSSALSSAPSVGFSGSRSSVPSAATAIAQLVSSRVVHLSGCGVHFPVFVGCARGVDSFFRGCFPSAQVFSVSGSSRGAFAARSISFVQSLAASGGVLVSFPSSPCPIGLLPSSTGSRAFSGFGSGSWASLAFAVGRGVQCFVFAPFGVPSGWGFVPCGDGWFSFTPSGSQLGLF